MARPKTGRLTSRSRQQAMFLAPCTVEETRRDAGSLPFRYTLDDQAIRQKPFNVVQQNLGLKEKNYSFPQFSNKTEIKLSPSTHGLWCMVAETIPDRRPKLRKHLATKA